jgi:hypothetical protein
LVRGTWIEGGRDQNLAHMVMLSMLKRHVENILKPGTGSYVKTWLKL